MWFPRPLYEVLPYVYMAAGAAALAAAFLVDDAPHGLLMLLGAAGSRSDWSCGCGGATIARPRTSTTRARSTNDASEAASSSVSLSALVALLVPVLFLVVHGPAATVAVVPVPPHGNK